MKNTFTKALLHANVLTKFICLAILLMSANLMFGQNAFDNNKGVGDLSSVTWKAVGDANTALSEETTKINLALAAPSLQDADKALFTAYKRLVEYVQVDVQSGISLDKSILASYDKVLAEIVRYPEGQHLPIDVFATWIPGLVETLTAVPQPMVGQF